MPNALSEGDKNVYSLPVQEGASVGAMAELYATHRSVNAGPVPAPLPSGGDDTATLQALVDTTSAGDTVILRPAVTYAVSGLMWKPGVHLNGNGSTFEQTAGASSSTYVLSLDGEETATATDLDSDGTRGDQTVSVASESGFTAGDYVLIRDDTYAYSSEGRNQELNRVASVASGTITLTNRLIGVYEVTANAQVVLIAPAAGNRIRDLTISIPAGRSGGGFRGHLCYDVEVIDCNGFGSNHGPAWMFNDSARVAVVRGASLDGQSVSSAGRGYGVMFQNCHNFNARGHHSEAVRENLVTGNCRWGWINQCTDDSAYDSAWNTHGTGNKHIFFDDCESVNSYQKGFSFGDTTHDAPDTDIHFRNCTIHDAGFYGFSGNALEASPNQRVSITGGGVFRAGIRQSGALAVRVSHCVDFTMDGVAVNGATTNVSNAVYLEDVTRGRVANSRITDLPNGWGISWTGCADLTIENNDIKTVSSNNVRAFGDASSGVVIQNNRTDDTSRSLAGTERVRGNVWGSAYDENRGASTIADGATITHNLVATPTSIRVTPSVSGEVAMVTAKSSTTFTVAIKKISDGTAGTSQAIYWDASV